MPTSAAEYQLPKEKSVVVRVRGNEVFKNATKLELQSVRLSRNTACSSLRNFLAPLLNIGAPLGFSLVGGFWKVFAALLSIGSCLVVAGYNETSTE